MKIWTKKELFKGYIPSDKIHFRGIPFEHIGLSYFDDNHLKRDRIKRMVDNFRQTNKIDELLEYVKFFLKASPKYKELIKENYHKIIYLNVNFDGIDCFIDR